MEKVDISDILSKSFSTDQEPVDLLELFEEKAKEYNLSRTHAGELLGLEYRALLPILKGTAKQPNLINVLKIAEFLEIDFKLMLASMVANQGAENVKKLQDARYASFLAKNFDVDRLYNEKFIKNKNDSKSIVDRILDFFGFDSISDYEEFTDRVGLAVFSKSKRNFVDKMRYFSVHSAYRLFEVIDNTNEYDRESLIDLMPKIKPFSQDVDNGLYTVCKALYSHGVTVIFQNHLPSSQYRGATMFVNDKPCIVITDLNKNYATIWFALLHELFHVLFDEEAIKSDGYHLTNEGESQITLINEEEADAFASDFFVDMSELKYIMPHIHNDFFVDKFAKKIKVHKSIIYSKYRFVMLDEHNKNYYGAFGKHFPNVEKAVNRLNPISWKKDYSISKIAENLKEIFDLKLEYERSEKQERTGKESKPKGNRSKETIPETRNT